MQSDINICNMALAQIGSQPINSFNDDTQQARVCRMYYEQTQNYLLSSYSWSFNKQTIKLVKSTDTVPGWSSIYVYPIEALYIVYIFDGGSPAINMSDNVIYDYSVNNVRRILTNITDAYAVCRVKSDDVSKWPYEFCEVMMWALASRIAIALAKSSEEASNCSRMLQITLSRAITNSANERNVHIAGASSWVEVHNQ